MSDKIKHSDDGFKYFIGYKVNEIVKPLCIILPQMSGYIKCFENGGKDMSFLTFSLCKTPLGETGCIGNPYFLLTGCLSIQFFNSPLFANTVS